MKLILLQSMSQKQNETVLQHRTMKSGLYFREKKTFAPTSQDSCLQNSDMIKKNPRSDNSKLAY